LGRVEKWWRQASCTFAGVTMIAVRRAAFLLPLSLLLVGAGASVSAPAHAANLPSLPGAATGAAPAAAGGGTAGGTSAAGASAAAQDPATVPSAPAPSGPAAAVIERVKRGVVLIERDGRLLGFGTVLGGDGRILTSLSALGPGEGADVRYADGAVVHAKLGHRDPTWDLALLVPHTIHWKDGLSASEILPGESDLRAPVPPRAGAKPIALPVHFKGRTDAISRQGDSLVDALDVDVHHALPITGAPILDQQATVVGVLVRACKLAVTGGSPQEAAKTGPLACAPTIIGAPVSAVRSFLSRTPADAVPPTPWLGIAGEPDESGPVHGVRVMAVAPQSPAQKAGLKGSGSEGGADHIVAVDGQPVDSPQKLAEAIGKHAIGDPVKLLLLGGSGSFREVAVVLRAAP
jgi:serine protease Do